MFTTDKIAILLATYNGEKFIGEQLDSLLAQTCQDWVCYIHDDGSKDKTLEIAGEYAEKHPDKFIIIPGPSTGGAKHNFLYLFRQVEAPIYMCCDQDDVWLEDKIELTMQAMEEEMLSVGREKPILVFTDLKVVDGELNEIAPSMREYQKFDCTRLGVNQFLLTNVVTGCTMMANRALRDILADIKEPDNIIMHDWYAALVAAKFGKMRYVDKSTILYRQHGNNTLGVSALPVYSIRYILPRLFDFSGIRNDIQITGKQAKEFMENCNLQQDELVSGYADLMKMGKMQRLMFYYKHDIRRRGIIRNIRFYLLG